MSWIEDIQNDLIITTGDGNEFFPQYLNASRIREYNTSEFDFTNISGTLVKRKQPRGFKYSIEIYFRGDDHLVEAQSFLDSADDPRPWVMSHPFYGRKTVQPLSLTQDNTQYNLSKFTGTVIETITDDSPKTVIVPLDKITEDKEALDTVFDDSFVTDVIPDTDDINSLNENNDIFFNTGSEIISETSDSEEYFNKFNSASAAILEATAEPLAAINSIQTVINAPALFVASVDQRVDTFIEQITILGSFLDTLITASSKKIYENNVGVAMSGLALAASNQQEGDYENRPQVVAVVEKILDVYNTFIDNLDVLQTDNGGDEESYIPDAESLIGLNDLINFTVSNLFNIALGTKQERSIILEDDSDAINLTHRFYELDEADELIDEFIETNNIGLDEILDIKKGRTIVYYI